MCDECEDHVPHSHEAVHEGRRKTFTQLFSRIFNHPIVQAGFWHRILAAYTVVIALIVMVLSPMALAGTIYIDVADIDNPKIWEASGGWGGASVTQTGDDSYWLSVGVVGAHRAWPATGTSRLILENEVDGSTVLGLRLSYVNWSELYWEATYYFELYTVDALGIYSGPDWSGYSVTSCNRLPPSLLFTPDRLT